MTDSSTTAEVCLEIPPGGPLYISDMVGPLTNISVFQTCVEDELEDLRKELSLDLVEAHRDEILVGELKILTEEELVNIAVEASFKDDDVARNSSSPSEGRFNGKSDGKRMLDTELPCSENSGREKDVVPSDAFKKGPQRKMNEGMSKKRKGVPKDKTGGSEDNYIAVVEKLAGVKLKQEEDKSAARLHSFDGATEPIACVNASEKKERLSSFKCKKTSFKVSKERASGQTPIHGSEILLCVEVYHSRRTWVKTQEIVVLGQQVLTEMRDKIQCLTDEIMRFHELYDPSGYFLIEDIFYNDLREAYATDYSKPILDWMKESEKNALEKWECILSGELQQKQKKLLGSGNGPRLPQLKSRPMQATCFRDISFRLGAGYLYCHQGDCKHVIVIRDMRLIRPDDIMIRAAYPLVIFQSRLRFLKCYVCNIYKARYVTVNDKGAPKNPCYFCKDCYYMLHYQDGKLLYDDFTVYDYLYEY